MNTLKLSLSNFQAITEGTLEFKTGLNFIIGQSNSGKTATFRAIKDCLLNPSRSVRHINNKAQKAVVTLEYNGNIITWTRTPNSSVYDINGQEYIKVGRSSAFKLLENNTGFVLGPSGTIMNIEEELQLPFPFGMSKQDLFKLYEDVFCISDSAVILKAAKAQEEQVKTTIGNIENEIIKNNKKIEELEKFKKEVDLEFLKKCRGSLKASSNRLETLRDGLPSIRIAVKLKGIEMEEINASFKNLLPAYLEKNDLKNLAGRLRRLHKLGATVEVNHGFSEKFLERRQELKSLQAEIDLLSKLKEITFDDFNIYSKLPRYSELKEAYEVASLLKKIKDIKLPTFSPSVNYQRYKELVQISRSLREVQVQIKEKRELLQKFNLEVEQLTEKLKEFKVCPLCHRPLED